MQFNRQLFGINRLRWAARGIRRASVYLTQLRRNARKRRTKLLRDVFGAGRSIHTVARALMGRRRLDEEELLPWRRELNVHRAEHAEVMAWASEWMLEHGVVAEE